ncbi:hypothetical protein O181_098877 [Austropuccinia psidii MF-1]|uniref:Uncharacterized protein n=1 Tax=Austropuccinia psidii MF-1 TaxID=1389203 RepID=A0A9Q3PFZ9_9BASI|nr:hypothetical protein [Austropuccinia psidii MF-1]
MVHIDERQADQTGLELVLQYFVMPHRSRNTFSTIRPFLFHRILLLLNIILTLNLETVLENPAKPPTTPENEIDLLGPLPSFLDGAAPSMGGPLSNWALS